MKMKHNYNLEELGWELRRIRIKNNVSTYDLRINQIHNLGRRIENGESNYTVKSLLHYCDFIGAEVEISNTLPLTITVK